MQRRTFALACLGLAMMMVSSMALAQYKLKNLDSNQVKQAGHDDPLIVNAWGMVHAPGSPWWISDNSSGWSTLYDGQGNIQSLKVLIPTAGNGPGSPSGLNGPGTPTGTVFNGSSDFQLGGWSTFFLFATLDGTISGWAPQTNLNQAMLAVDNSSKGSVYTGLAITNKTSGNFLYAADEANGKVDVYDGSFNFVKSFTDSSLPAGFAPFGIQDIGGLVYVTFADVSGGSGGFVDVFKEDGTPARSTPLIQGLPLNQPWGVAVAPNNFGPLSNTLLISNNTDQGTINGFNAINGKFVARVRNDEGKPIVIDQLWGIGFGDGSGPSGNGALNQLFFTAGPNNNVAGTFGVIVLDNDRAR